MNAFQKILGLTVTTLTITTLGFPAQAGTPNYNNLINANGAITHLGLDETSGMTAGDATGHGHAATYGAGVGLGATSLGPNVATGATGHTSPIAILPGNSAFSFGAGDFSVEMYFQPGASSTQRQDLFAFAGNGADLGIFLNTNGAGAIAFYDGNYAVTNAGVVTPNQWHSLVVTRASGTVSVYLDGTVVISSVGDVQSINAATAVYLGSSKDGLSNLFQGSLDEVAIYAKALSPLQITADLAAAGAPVPVQAAASIFSGPIQITSGGTYTGNWLSTNPNVPVVNISTNDPVTFINSRFMGPGDLITTTVTSPVANLTILNSQFTGMNPNVAGQARGLAIRTGFVHRLSIQNCDFECTGGVNVNGSVTPYFSDFITSLLYNRFHNVDGRLSDGAGGYQTGHALYSAIQVMNQWAGAPALEVGWNQIIEDPYNSRVEDTMSFFDFNASSSSPALIHDNYIQGSYRASGETTNYTGTAINAEGGSHTDPTEIDAFINIYNNQIVNSGGGIAISGGHDNAIHDNRLVNTGVIGDGTFFQGGNVCVWNYQENAAPVWGNNAAYHNLSGALNYVNGVASRNDYLFLDPPTTQYGTAATNYGNSSWTPNDNAHPTPADEANELVLWQTKLNTAGIAVGSTITSPFLYANVATGGTVTASGDTAPTGAAALAFDGSSGSQWTVHTTNATAWLQYQFAGGASWAIDQYQMTSATNNPACDPKNWQLLGSHDGSTWVTLNYQVGQAFSARGQTKTYNFVNSTAYAYYRLNISGNNGGPGNDIQLSELALNVEGTTTWNTQDIRPFNAVTGSANYSYTTNVYTAAGSGDDIWNASDSFRYIYQPINGDCSITARVVSQGNSDGWAKAGVMIRETLNPNSTQACVLVTPSNGINFQYRSTTNGASTNVAGPTSATAPYWVRITRKGNTFTAYASADNVTWTLVGTTTFTMASSVYIGLPVTSHHIGLLSSAVFDNVILIP